MENAAFAIRGYRFDKVSINFDNKTSDDISISFNTRGEFYPKDRVYRLIFATTVFNDEKNIEKPFLHAQCIGDFIFKENIEEIPDFFFSNAIAILYPYLRAYISLITTQANLPGIILPTYNLSSLGSELKKNTIVK